MKKNPFASIVINELPYTIQIDGKVKELHGNQFEKAKKLLIRKHGKGTGFYSDPGICFFRFTPTWIRLLVSAGYPPKYAMIKK